MCGGTVLVVVWLANEDQRCAAFAVDKGVGSSASYIRGGESKRGKDAYMLFQWNPSPINSASERHAPIFLALVLGGQESLAE
jgi:hypothetical protein